MATQVLWHKYIKLGIRLYDITLRSGDKKFPIGYEFIAWMANLCSTTYRLFCKSGH